MDERNDYLSVGSAATILSVYLLITITCDCILVLLGSIFNISPNNPGIYSIETILSFFILLNYLENENMGVNLKVFFYYDKKIIHCIFPLTIIIGSSFVILMRIENLVLTFIPMKEEIKVLFENLFGGNISLLGSIIGGVIVASIVEECLFRGIILNGFLKKYNPLKAIFYSTGIFTLFHLNPWQLIAPFTLGIILSICFYKTRSLYVCIYCHSLYNLISIMYVKFNKNHSFGNIVNIPLWIYLLAIIVFLIGVIIGKRALKRKIKKIPNRLK